MSNQFLMPQKVIFGKNSLNECFSSIIFPGNKAFIVTDKSMIKLGYINEITDILTERHVDYFIFDEVNFEPNDICINYGLKLYKENECDFLIGFGGGSPVDAMKAISIMLSSNKSLPEYIKQSFDEIRPYMIAIPTTAGTGSEATQFTIITDTITNIKMLIKGQRVIPDLSIIYPKFTISLPPKVTVSTGIDALCHAIEAYISKKSNPLSDIYAMDAIKKIFTYLPICFKDPSNIEAREQMSIASFEAGCAFNNSSVTLIHGMSRPIGANFHIPHGLSNAVLMYECLLFVKDCSAGKFAEISRTIGYKMSDNDTLACQYFFDSLKNLLQTLQIPSLKDIILNQEQFLSLIDKMAQDAIDSGSPSNIVKLIEKKDIKSIYYSLIK